MIERYLIQMVALCLAIIGVATWTLWGLRHRSRRLYAVAPLSWLLHVMIYYMSVLIDNPIPGSEIYTSWSAVLRLHGVILILGAGIIMNIPKQ